MAEAFEMTLNGRLLRIENESPNTTLLDYLRKNGLTGSKEGCAEGDCGACSVAMIDRDASGKATYRAINSCLVPICLMAGREIVTVEGVGCRNKLHPVQQKMVERHGSQCGYCTPGFIVSMFEGYYRTDIDTADRLDDQLCGNLCRCTGYRPIRDAAIEAFSQKHKSNGQDPFVARLKARPNPLFKTEYRFEQESFSRPDSLMGLFLLMREHPAARLIAGATELGLEISKRFKKFSEIISVEAVPELKAFHGTDSAWEIGAAVTLTEIEDRLGAEIPALARMLRVFGSRQIRNRATMGGNIVTASPIGDSAPVLLALDAKLVIASLKDAGSKGNGHAGICERTIPITEFFVAYRKTALQPGEILKTIVIPKPRVQRGVTKKLEWYKVSRRREMDISTVAGCFALELDSAGTIQKALLAYGGVSAMPARALKTEAVLQGKPWNRDTLTEALQVLAREFAPITDVRGTAEFRQGLITTLLEKFFDESVAAEVTRLKLSVVPKRSNGLEPRHLGCYEEEERLLTLSSVRTKASPHESGHKHVSGEAMYVDDVAAGKPMLEVWPVCSPHARAKILKRDATVARQMPGIRAVLLAEDIPGENDVGTKHDECLLPATEVSYHGQPVALIVGDTADACRAAAEKVSVEYEPLHPILTLEEAISAGSFHNEPNFIRRGDTEPALANAPLTLKGTFELGGQEHFYLETQAAWAEPGEDGSVFVASSTQHPSEVQMVVAHALGLPFHKVVVQSPRMGGGFGGKETQAAMPAALAALAASKTGRGVRVRFNRDQDMAITGHRHPFRAKFEVGFDAKGTLRAVRVHLCSNGGWALDLSQAVTDRALFHLDNAYYIPAVEFSGQVAKTNLSSNTAFRGFGGPQGMLVIEEILDRVARSLGLPPELVRERNLYRGKGETNTTHYGQQIEDNRIQTIWKELKKSSELDKRRKSIARWNSENEHRKRGIAITPVKFGISFTVTHLNQAGALVLMYQDGTVQVNHGGTEMGQGLHTNIVAITARELGVKPDNVRIMPTSTDKVPNTSATAASCGTDLNGAAVKNACEILRRRLIPVAAQLLKEKNGKAPKVADIQFANGCVRDRKVPKKSVRVNQVLRTAYLERISLSTSGYYCTPGIHWDRVAGRGKPFHYFAYGAAVAEVEVDGFTGMHRVLRVDILHDVGDSINEGINRGQVEGGFIQGMGWLTTEELKWDAKGRLQTHSPDTYKIPAIGDTPEVFNVTLLKNAAQKNVVYGTKAVGEPPLMLAISVREAIRDAVAAFGDSPNQIELPSPATCEAVFMSIQKQRKPIPRPNYKATLPGHLNFGTAAPR